MSLSKKMRDEVAGVHVDASDLARAAAAQGQHTVRRRRRARTAATLVAAVAAVAAIAIGTTVLTTPTTRQPAPVTERTITTPNEPAPATRLVTGREIVAAMLQILPGVDGLQNARVVPDTIAGNTDTTVGDEMAYGQLTIRRGEDTIDLAINVQRWSVMGLDAGCRSSATNCDTMTLRPGDTVTTYEPQDGKDQAQRTAELVSQDRDLRVIITASYTPNSDTPPTFAQLSDMVTWPGWTLQFPASYATDVAQLPSFEATN